MNEEEGVVGPCALESISTQISLMDDRITLGCEVGQEAENLDTQDTIYPPKACVLCPFFITWLIVPTAMWLLT